MDFPVQRLLDWYTENKRDLPWRLTNDIYPIWLSEVMLQQTQVATVIPYYLRFLERFPTIETLARASEDEVLKMWEGLGYYSRIRNLHRAAREVVEVYHGKIPAQPDVFRKLPGVGPYIVAAVLSIARGIPLPAVDGNVMRVYTRFRGIGDDIRKTATRNRISDDLQRFMPRHAASDFTQAFMELGALICSPKTPKCNACPLKPRCVAFTTQSIPAYPFKSPRGKVPHHQVSVAVITRGERFYIQKRPSKGHLGGLWEFPGGKAEAGETPEQALVRECREELGVGIEILDKLAVVRHAYSHFKITMSVFICGLNGREVHQPEGHSFQWITIDRLEDYPFPGANHKFFPRLRDYFHPRPSPGG
ncbi:MAG: A/G-specific adenine glycosylase [bacterium]|nr:A/G-specific adenine glycosylase [bacterium]